MKRLSELRPLAPGRLSAVGTAGWLFTGLAAACGIVLIVLTALRPLLLPLFTAAALATVLQSLVETLAARRIPRTVGALLGCLLVIGLLVLTVTVVVAALSGQADDIGGTLDRAGNQLVEIAGDLGIGQQQATEIRQAVEKAAPSLLTGLLTGLASGAQAVIQLVLGCTLGVYMLFFLLKDTSDVQDMVLRALPMQRAVANEAAARAAVLVRRYFAGMTVIGLVNSVLVTVGALILQVPLAGAIALVTFLLAYIPYLGALVSGAFAVLLALGSGGTETAIWMLVIVLLANGGLQNLLEPFAFGAALRMHPLVVLLATVIAGVFAGVAGVVMAAPLTAIALDTARLLRQQNPTQQSSAGA